MLLELSVIDELRNSKNIELSFCAVRKPVLIVIKNYFLFNRFKK